LNGLPVTASGDFITYRLKKYVKRHRMGIALSSSFLLILASIIIFYTVKLQDQTRQAQAEAAKATAVSEFIGSLFETASSEEARGKVVTAQDILAAGAGRIERELMDAPDVQATMFNVIGDVYRRIADYDKAEELMQKSLQQYQMLYGPDSEEVLTLITNLGVLYYQTGKFDKSDSLLNLAMAGFSHEKYNPQTKADILSAKAEVVFEKGNIAEADSFYMASLELYKEVHGTEHPRLADILLARGSIARRQKNFKLAESMYLQALEMRRKLLGNDHPDIAHSLNHLGRLKYQMGQYQQAENYAREGLDLR
jgi:tetratricopeptide (TPR) repeat protein